MEPDQLRKAIEAPARAVGCEVEAALVEVLLDESGNEPGNLPLLEFVMLELWKSRTGELLTLAAYEKTGRLHGALDQHAEKIYLGMAESQRAICRSLFLQLAQPWQDDRFTRRRVTLAQLLDRRPGTSAKSIGEVLEVLAGPDARLISIRAPDHGNNQIDIDLAHDALLTSWERLTTWLKEERDFLDWRQRIGIGIKDWNHFQRDPECLLHGARLDEARVKLAGKPEALNTEEVDYIQASLEFRRSQRLKRALTIGAQAALSLGVVALAARWIDGRANLIETTRQAIQSKSPCAVVYALHAHGLPGKAIAGLAGFGEAETHRLLEEAVQGDSAPLIETDLSEDMADVRFSPDGKYVATSSYDKTAALWGPDGISLFPSKVMVGRVLAVAFSTDSSLVAASDQSGTVQAWRTPSGELAFTVPQQAEAITAVEFVPGGNTLLMGSASGQVLLFDGQGVNPFPRGHQGEITAIAFSMDGKRFATASKDGTARMWSFEARTGSALPVPPMTTTVDSIAYSRDHILGGTLMGNGTVYQWDAQGSSMAMPAVTALNGMAVSRDGNTLATSEAPLTLNKTGSTIRIWNTQSLGRANLTMEYPGGDLKKLALNSDGSRLAVALPRAVRIYELNDAPLAAAARQIIERKKARESQAPGLLNACRAFLP